MALSKPSSGCRRPTVVVLGILVAFLVTMFVLVVVKAGSGGREGTSSRSASKTATSGGPTTTTRGRVTYTVMPGETLIAIAKRFGVSTKAIVDASQLPDANHLTAGQVLVIPPVTPVRLVVKPATAPVGDRIELHLSGAQPFELITFEIQRPTGPFTGSPHSANEKGEVTTTYQLGFPDPPGTYTVIAKGDQVTAAQANFRVVALRKQKSPA